MKGAVVIGSLDDFQKNILYVFPYITCFCQRSSVRNRKGYICVDICAEIIEEEMEKEEEASVEASPPAQEINLIKPEEMKAFLDEYVR